MGFSKRLQHALQHIRGIANRDFPTRALDGYPHKSEFRNGGGQQAERALASALRNPRGDPLVALVIAPTPSDQNVHIEKEFHQGKSASISRTASEVSGGVPGGGAKIIAPVCGHLMRAGFAGGGDGATAC